MNFPQFYVFPALTKFMTTATMIESASVLVNITGKRGDIRNEFLSSLW